MASHCSHPALYTMRPSPCLLVYALVFSSLAYLVTGAAALALANNSSLTWKNCGDPRNAVKFKSVEIFPDPPIPGKRLTVKVAVDISNIIEEEATGVLTVKLEGHTVIENPFEICKEARNTDLTAECPIKPGKYTVKRTVTLPNDIPTGKYTITVVGYTKDGEDLMCLSLGGEITRTTWGL
ncbi:hypothetical protein BDZ89DRAFT_1016714 [Hymenopellis radicata]|nr:hypothetical protein BDZ89DRAFT_1016714 [Hymenopellis radicata]